MHLTHKSQRLLEYINALPKIEAQLKALKTKHGNPINAIHQSSNPRCTLASLYEGIGNKTIQSDNIVNVPVYLKYLMEQAEAESLVLNLNFRALYTEFKAAILEEMENLENYIMIYARAIDPIVTKFLNAYCDGYLSDSSKFTEEIENLVSNLLTRKGMKIDSSLYFKVQNVLNAETEAIFKVLKRATTGIKELLIPNTENVSKEIRNFSDPEYFGFQNPINFPLLKAGNSVCSKGNGIILDEQDSNNFYAIYEEGIVIKVEKKEKDSTYKIVTCKKFDVGFISNSCSLAINPSGSKLVVSGYYNQNIYLINKNLNLIRQWLNTGNGEELETCCFIDPKKFCAGYSKGTIKLFGLDENPLYSVVPFSNGITVMKLSKRCKQSELFIGDASGRLYIFDVTKKEVKYQMKYHNSPISMINKFPISDKCIISALSDNFAIVIDMKTREIIEKIELSSTPHQIFFSPGEKNIIALCDETIILISNGGESLSIRTNQKIDAFQEVRLQSMAVNWLSKTLVIGDNKGNIWMMGLQNKIAISEKSENININ